MKYKGLAGAAGRAVGRVVLMSRRECVPERRTVADSAKEVERFNAVRKEYCAELARQYDRALQRMGEETAGIFTAYRLIAEDAFFFQEPLSQAVQKRIAPDYPVEQEKQRVCGALAAAPDPYMRARADDIRNVCDELIRRYNGIYPAKNRIDALAEDFIAAAEDLSPTETLDLDPTHLAGIITERGGVTSHVVILAKTLGIPAVVGAAGMLQQLREGDTLFLDGSEGYAESSPDPDFLRVLAQERQVQQTRRRFFEQAAARSAATADGKPVRVCVNSGDRNSLSRFDPLHCDGVGLFRTEFLYLDRSDYPSEQTQFEIYRSIAEKAGGKEVIIRTLDIGGDKQVGYMRLPEEHNPFLGYRAIRLCLDRKDIFHTQLRAILRASVYGNIKIMLPMLVCLDELREARACLEHAKQSLRQEGLPFRDDLPLGVMIETPAAVLLSRKFAAEADFFSIGTNDLIQYMTAADRQNETVQYLYDPCSVAVLTAIASVIENAHSAGIPVGMCGEAASDALLTPLLLEMGLDEFSVVPAQVGQLKAMIAQYDLRELHGLTQKVLVCATAKEVRAILTQYIKTV